MGGSILYFLKTSSLLSTWGHEGRLCAFGLRQFQWTGISIVAQRVAEPALTPDPSNTGNISCDQYVPCIHIAMSGIRCFS